MAGHLDEWWNFGPDPFVGVNRNSADWVPLVQYYPGQLKPWEGPAGAWTRVTGDETGALGAPDRQRNLNCWETGRAETGLTLFCEKASLGKPWPGSAS
jgi:hypothetical protein